MEDIAYYDTVDTCLKKGEAIGFEKGEAKGRKEYAAEKVNEIARQLKKEGVDLALITKASWLSLYEVEAL